MSSTAALAPTPVSDLTVWPFPIQDMTSASCVFEEHWAFPYSVVAIPPAALELLSPVVAGARPWHSAASAWSPAP